MPTPPDPFDSLLDRWSDPPPPQPHLAADVWRRIEHAEERRAAPNSATPRNWFAAWFARPAFALGTLAVCVAATWIAIEWRASRRYEEQRTHLARSYLQLIDPLVSTLEETRDLAPQLVWLQRELGLSDAQFAEIKALHAASGPRLRALAQEVARLRAELQSFEEARRTTERVDFLAFARTVEAQQDIDRACLDSTRRLVEATASVMTPDQRSRYFGMLNPNALN